MSANSIGRIIERVYKGDPIAFTTFAKESFALAITCGDVYSLNECTPSCLPFDLMTTSDDLNEAICAHINAMNELVVIEMVGGVDYEDSIQKLAQHVEKDMTTWNN